MSATLYCRGWFVTGTDTGVGKTHVMALLLAEFRRRGLAAAGFKPIACGAGGRADARLFRRLMQNEVPLDTINPVYLSRALAPSVAARLDHRRIQRRRLCTAYAALAAHHEIVLVEGAGGLLVPIQEDYFVADLARELALPLVVVARLGLGTINHTLLTIRQARAMGLAVAGLILNDTLGGRRGQAERTNIEVLPRLAGVPLLGVIPHEACSGTGLSPVPSQICDRLLGK